MNTTKSNLNTSQLTFILTPLIIIVGMTVVLINRVTELNTDRNVNGSVSAMYAFHDQYNSPFMTIREVQSFSPTTATEAEKENVVNFCEEMFTYKNAFFMDKQFKVILTQNVNTCAELGTRIKNQDLTYGLLSNVSRKIIRTYTDSEYIHSQEAAANTARNEKYAQLESRAEKIANWK